MKIRKYILPGMAALLLGMTSCADFLKVDSTDSQNTDSFYKTEGQMDQALSGIYNGLLPISSYIIHLSEFRSDNVWVNLTPNGQRDYSDIGGFKLSVNNSMINDVWVDYYDLIARANLFLEKLPAVTFSREGIKESYELQARFLRAFAYFDLVRFYGRVPVVTKSVTATEAGNIKQSEAVDVYEKVIIPDLLAALKLPLESKDYLGKTSVGRVTQIAAKALLGRVYLTMAGFPLKDESKKEEARKLLEEVIDYAASTGKYWAKDAAEWEKMWISENDNKYHIFEIQYINGGTKLGNPMVFNSCPVLYSAYTDVRIFGNNVYVEDMLDQEFKKQYNGKMDARCLATIDTTKFVNTDGSTPIYYTDDDFFIKFLEHKMKRARLGYSNIDKSIVDYNDWPINFPIIRLEDVMLMYAEIVGPTTKGLKMVNDIRTRANMDEIPAGVSPDDFQNYVERERRLELAFEGIRWHDLVRHNNLQAIRDMFIRYDKAEYANNVKDGMHIYPIPEAQILVKRGLYEQNEAYK